MQNLQNHFQTSHGAEWLPHQTSRSMHFLGVASATLQAVRLLSCTKMHAQADCRVTLKRAEISIRVEVCSTGMLITRGHCWDWDQHPGMRHRAPNTYLRAWNHKFILSINRQCMRVVAFQSSSESFVQVFSGRRFLHKVASPATRLRYTTENS